MQHGLGKSIDMDLRSTDSYPKGWFDSSKLKNEETKLADNWQSFRALTVASLSTTGFFISS